MIPNAAAEHPGIIYHRWYYDSGIWQQVSFLGVTCLKSVTDLWNYQEILTQIRPSLLIEFGTACGGSALYFAHILGALNPEARVLTVDINPTAINSAVREHPRITCMHASTTDPAVAETITRMRSQAPGPAFAIIDSDHRRQHVLAELLLLRPVLIEGDYLIVEDTNINGHPVLPGWGDGPMEALTDYERQFPSDYRHDSEREGKFGFTFAPNGFLVRNA